jgi:hypothetical protein
MFRYARRNTSGPSTFQPPCQYSDARFPTGA